MKKGIVILLSIVFSVIILSLTLNSVYAYDLALSKGTYYPAETLQLEIPDIFVDNLIKTNIGIYQQDAVHKTPAESNLFKSSGKYYFYAVLPIVAGNYSIKIENQIYNEGSVKSNATIIKSFNIIDTNSSYLSINPGAVFTTADFKVQVKAYNAAQIVSVEFLANGFKQNFSLGNGMDKTVYIPVNNISSFTISSLKINSYMVPVVVSPQSINATINTTIETSASLEDLIEISPSEINATLMENLHYSFDLEISNIIGLAFGDINVSSTNSKIIINKTILSSFSGKKTFTIIINSDKDFSGNIILSYKNGSLSIPVNIKITRNESDTNYSVLPTNLQKTCSQLQGLICDYAAGERCTGIEEDSLSGVCCLAECNIKKSSSTWLWGVVLLIFIGIGAWLLYKKSKSTPGREKANEIVKQRSEDYEKRISPSEEELKEVRKSLSKE